MPQKSILTLRKPQPASKSSTSHLPLAAYPSITRRPTTPLSLLTTSWMTLNQEQLALETWTCKDPLCRRPHHQSPMDYHSIPSIVGPCTWRPCPRQSSEDGSVVIHSPCPCMAASPLLVEGLDRSLYLYPTVPHFTDASPSKAHTALSHARPLRPLPKRTSHTWRQQMARQQLAVDAAHAILSGVSSRLHPFSLKYRSPAQSPPNHRIPDRVAEATHTNHRQQ
jgi:hypothetical protein